MLSQGSLNMINFFYTIVSDLRTIPFEWDSERFLLRPVSKSRYALSILFSLKLWSNLVFVIFRCCQSISAGVPAKLVLFLVLEIVRLSLGSVMQFINVYQPRDVICNVNQVLQFNIMLRGVYSKETESMLRKSDMCEKLMKTFIVVGVLQSVIYCLDFLRDPYKVLYLYSLLDTRVQVEYWNLLRLPFLLSLILDLVIYWNVVLFDLYVILMNGCGAVMCFTELKKSNTSSRRTLSSIRSKEASFGLFRCLQLLDKSFNGCYASLGMPTLQLCLLLMDVLPLFMTARLHSTLPFLKFVAIPLRASTTLLLTLYIFPMLANIHQLSLRFIRDWKHSSIRLGKRDTKFLKSCAPLKMKSGSLYFMRRFTVFKVFGLVLYYTMKLLLIF